MRTRLAAATVLGAAAMVAWFVVIVPPAARVIQVVVAISVAYVAWLAWHGWREIRSAVASAGSEPPAVAPRPFVSLVLPARNEAASVGGTIAALVALDYRDAAEESCHELLVVDDGSTDGTRAVAEAASAGHAHVRVVRREPGTGPATKGAVLAWAMPQLRGEVIGAIDADTRIAPDFLSRVLGAWERDSEAAALQVARVARNASASWLTRAQEEEQLMDLASQCGRWATDGTAELRGNGMFVRRDALEAVGGWGERALTEDLDLSTRLAAAGRGVTLAPEVAVREEAVETVGALWRQRLRWAEGSLRRLLEHGPALLAGRVPIGRKADFLAFAAEFAVPPLFAATAIASFVTIFLPSPTDWTVPASLAVGYGLGTFALALAGLHGMGVRGLTLVGRATRGAMFLTHWLLVVPYVLLRIAVGPETTGFTQTPRFTTDR